MFGNFITLLEAQLKNPLPGEVAQYLMAPQGRLPSKQNPQENMHAKKGGVLLLLYPKNGKVSTVLTLRSEYNGVHSGQVSLPGGKQEKGESLYSTALRESKEEIGIDPERIILLGALTSLYIPVSNFQVYPFIAYTATEPTFSIDTNEVQVLIETTTETLREGLLISTKSLELKDGRKVKAPCYELGGFTVWGATAMILSEFVAILKQLQSEKN